MMLSAELGGYHELWHRSQQQKGAGEPYRNLSVQTQRTKYMPAAFLRA